MTSCVRMARATRSSVFDWYGLPIVEMPGWIDAAVTVAKEEKEAQNGR